MNVARLFDWITPLVIVAVMGVIMAGYGLVYPAPQNNALQFIFGIPIALGAAGFHYLIRRLLKRNTLYVWLVEALIVASLTYQFLYVW